MESIDDSSTDAIWKMYSVAKASLPYKDRMSNLTWRMLGMRMVRERQRFERASIESSVASSASQEAGSLSLTNVLEHGSEQPREKEEGDEEDQVGLKHHHQFSSDAGTWDPEYLFKDMDLEGASPAIQSDTSDLLINPLFDVTMLPPEPPVTGGDSQTFLEQFLPPPVPTQDFLLSSFDNDIGSRRKTTQPLLPPTPMAVRQRRSSGVQKKKPAPIRNNSTTSLTSMDEKMDSPPKDTKCTHCHTRTTPLWRRDPIGNPLCNACGLFLKLHGVVRPLSLKTDVIKKRQRNTNNNKVKGVNGVRRKEREGEEANWEWLSLSL